MTHRSLLPTALSGFCWPTFALSVLCWPTFALSVLCWPAFAQLAQLSPSPVAPTTRPVTASSAFSAPIELYTRGYGAIVGVQQGRRTFFELGGEANWRTVKLAHPVTYGVGGNLEYNFGQGTFGLKAFGWARPGRLNFTYGAHLVYYTNVLGSRAGVAPNLGYKLLGFHFLVGANLLGGNREMTAYNPFFFTIRYFAPIEKHTGFR